MSRYLNSGGCINDDSDGDEWLSGYIREADGDTLTLGRLV